jgi:hypothetical protein
MSSPVWSLRSARINRPRDTAIIAEIDGIVRYGELAKGMRKIAPTTGEGGRSSDGTVLAIRTIFQLSNCG